MKTIGARRGQIISMYLVLIMIYGIIAFLIAWPLSSRVAYLLLESLASEINLELQGFRAIPLAIAIQLLVALVIQLAAGIWPLLHGTRISAVEALNGFNSEKPQRKGWFDRQLVGIRGVSRPLLISLRNTFRRKGRLVLTLLTLTLGGAIFIATFNVQGSLSNYITRIGKYFLADVNLSLDSYQRDLARRRSRSVRPRRRIGHRRPAIDARQRIARARAEDRREDRGGERAPDTPSE